MHHDHQKLVFVTGPAGAGRSTAINALEDLGFEAIDNLPLSLIPRLLEGGALPGPLVLGIDTRTRDFSAVALERLIDKLTDDPKIDLELVYFDCHPDVLIRRYSETRRRHPLSPADSPEVGIAHEVDLLQPIKARADVLIDTTGLTPHQLKAEIGVRFGAPTGALMSLSVQSFSYKRGAPRGVDMMFDCRFLRNPHWSEGLRTRTGQDPTVAAFVEADPRFAAFFTQVSALIESLLPAFIEEGKSNLTVAFGCTGGQHRSVFMAEAMSKRLAQQGWHVSIRHRELERRAGLSQIEQTV